MSSFRSKYFRKGYVYIFLFSIVIPILYILKYILIGGPIIFKKFLFRFLIQFLISFTIGFILVKWYYKVKDSDNRNSGRGL